MVEQWPFVQEGNERVLQARSDQKSTVSLPFPPPLPSIPFFPLPFPPSITSISIFSLTLISTFPYPHPPYNPSLQMSFRTSKCTHGQKGMCIHCMVNKNKQQKQQPTPKEEVKLQCKHPPHMKCLRCLPSDSKQSACQHPDYVICKNCQHMLKYDKFSYYIETLHNQCSHKKPCGKCVPPMSRKTYYIDQDCKKHLPYPQALCDSCMAPTVTISSQKYAHISRVILKTKEVFRIVESKLIGILLGRVIEDVAYIENVYFPEHQEQGSNYMNPFQIKDRDYLFNYFNLKQIGILYSSPELSGMNLMMSSLFQEKYIEMEEGQPISKFITMRLQLQGQEPHVECFMVSDQFQAFHRHGIIYQKENHQNYFDLITAKDKENHSKLPTFLREGIETDQLYFKESIVWIPTSEDETFAYDSQYHYPYFTLQKQTLQSFKEYVELPVDPIEKYRNVQFLLHLERLMGKEALQLFLRDYYLDEPELFLKERLAQEEKKEMRRLKSYERGHFYS